MVTGRVKACKSGKACTQRPRRPPWPQRSPCIFCSCSTGMRLHETHGIGRCHDMGLKRLLRNRLQEVSTTPRERGVVSFSSKLRTNHSRGHPLFFGPPHHDCSHSGHITHLLVGIQLLIQIRVWIFFSRFVHEYNQLRCKWLDVFD